MRVVFEGGCCGDVSLSRDVLANHPARLMGFNFRMQRQTWVDVAHTFNIRPAFTRYFMGGLVSPTFFLGVGREGKGWGRRYETRGWSVAGYALSPLHVCE